MYAIRSYYGFVLVAILLLTLLSSNSKNLPYALLFCAMVYVVFNKVFELYGLFEGRDMVAIFVSLRITSYNVCYTKLLREKIFIK